jgi:hypothetical protein
MFAEVSDNDEDSDKIFDHASADGGSDSGDNTSDGGAANDVDGGADSGNVIEDEDFIDKRIEIIEEKLLKEYLAEFDDFIKILLDYTKNNKLIVFKTNRMFNIYSRNSLADATNIANLFVAKSKYIKVITKVPYIIFDIQVKFNNFCRVTKIMEFRGVSYYDLYGDRQNINKQTSEISYLKDQIYISRIVELIKIYSELYSFTNEDEWESLKRQELICFSYYDATADNKKFIHGGAQPDQSVQSEIYKIIKDLDCVLVGNFAVANLVDAKINFATKIQLIANDIEPIVEAFKTKGINVNVKHDKFAFPFELRLMVTTLELEGTIFMEIFNCGKYDVIMCKKINGIKIAHPYVICKFLFVELFKFQILLHSNKIPENVYTKKKSEIIDLASKIRNIEFNKIEIFGIHHDEELAIKEDIGNANMYHPYEPYKYFLTFQKYREIK